jgi:hypothetical protein
VIGVPGEAKELLHQETQGALLRMEGAREEENDLQRFCGGHCWSWSCIPGLLKRRPDS